MIRTIEDLQKDVNELKTRQDLMTRQRKDINSSLRDLKTQIERLEEMILNNNQYEIFN